jgi:hypothetical protein
LTRCRWPRLVMACWGEARVSRNRSLALNGVESITSVDIVAQWVRVSWTKRSWGGSAAALRNAVPVAFPLPEIVAPLTRGRRA